MADPLINVARVEDRVSKGGHPVSPERIVARYECTMRHLYPAVCAADRSSVFDNSGDGLHRLVAQLERAQLTHLAPEVPAWVQTHLLGPLEGTGG